MIFIINNDNAVDFGENSSRTSVPFAYNPIRLSIPR